MIHLFHKWIEHLEKRSSSKKIQSRFSYVEIEDADHGFMYKQRASFKPSASALGLKLLMNELSF
tara:strand:- start:147 stop:338 length:192 start_codon:yes stop_codon:yes gene_type:complete